MKKLFASIIIIGLASCSSADNQKEQATTTNTATTSASTEQPDNTSTPDAAAPSAKFLVDGKEMSLGASLLVQKDKDKLKPGNDYLCVLTASGGSNKEALTLNFLLDTKPGTYPVVGMGFQRGPSNNGEVYGGLMGGTPKITKHKVTITECKDLGENGFGGHKWSISGSFEDIVIDAMPVMLMDETRKHPKDVTIKGGKFFNLTFDDNWEEIMKQGMERIKG